MDPSDTNSPEDRLGKLEASVADLQRKLSALTEALASRAEPHEREPVRVAPARTTQDRKTRPRAMGVMASPTGSAVSRRRTRPASEKTAWQLLLDRGPQFWISRLGIGLVLLSVVFLFDYAIDRGWLTPPIRVACGLTLGVALATIGLIVRRKEPWFSQVMLGGASASWYITGFAAFQLLHVFSHPVAFAFMVAVTVFTFWASIREDGAALAVLGAIGALGTPFFLYTAEGSVPGLVGYTCLVLLGASGIYLVKGWRSLLWTSVAGGWTVLLLAYLGAATSDRLALQLGIVATWLMLAVVAVGRELLASANPDRWQLPQSRLRAYLSQTGNAADPQSDIALLTVATPLGALFFSRAIWESSDALWGAIALGVGLCYAAVATFIRRKPGLSVLTSAHIVAVAFLAVVAVALLFGDDLQIVLWTALVVAFLYLAQKLDEATLRRCGHILAVMVAGWLLQRLTGEGGAETAVFTARGISDAGVFLGLLVASRWSGSDVARGYQFAAHAAFLGWLWRELSALPSGDAIVTASWGIYGLVLLTASAKTRKVGLATLLIAVAKLFLVDLDRVDPFLRILLFLGFGGLFLAISYYYRDRWQSGDTDSRSQEETDTTS